MPSVEFPEDSVQGCLCSGSWWEADDSRELIRGKLVWAHVQFFDEIPLQLIPTRAEDREHDRAILRALPLRAIQTRSEHEQLPVAGLPRRDGADGFVVNRAKRRPCLVLAGVEPTRVTDRDSRGQPTWSVAPFVLAAPYYSVDQDGRAGYAPELVEKMRHVRFRQFMYDRLPLRSSLESILRFDQMFPLSHNAQCYAATDFRLTAPALTLVDEWLDWYITGNLPADSELAQFGEMMRELDAACG